MGQGGVEEDGVRLANLSLLIEVGRQLCWAPAPMLPFVAPEKACSLHTATTGELALGSIVSLSGRISHIVL